MEAYAGYHGGIRKVLHDARSHPWLLVTLTAYRTFAVLLFVEGFFFADSFMVAGFEFPLLAAFLFLCAGVCLLCACTFKKIKVFSKDEYLWFLVSCMLLGVFFLFMKAHAGMTNDMLGMVTLVLGMLLLAVGVMGTHIELGRIFGMLGMLPTLTYGIGSALATAVLTLLITLFLDEVIKWAVTFLLPVIIIMAFYLAKEDVFPDQRELYREPTSELFIPYRFMATSIVQGFALGVPLGFLAFSGFFVQVLNSAGYLCAALLALLVVLVLQKDFNRAVYQVGFSLAGLGLLVMGVLGSTSALAGVLQLTGFLYLDLVLWGLGSYLIKNCDQPAMWVVSCPCMALMTGRALGVVVGCLGLEIAGGGGAHQPLFFCVLAFLVVLAALFLSSNANMRTGWGFVRPGEPDATKGENRICEIIGQEYGLTLREREIMQCIVGGKSRKEIAEELFITSNTIKTHLHNLYGKLDIHSESELKKFVARREKMLSTADDPALVS